MPTPTLDFAAMNDAQVREALSAHRIGLTVEEARKVQDMLKRPPTVTEATIWGIQGSEHCSYKSSRRFLKAFPTTGKHVILGPKEDSGIVAITDGPDGKRWGLVVSHESHNHPSQVVPYEGAATGVGGCVRDVVCMGARVIGSLDSLRLGDLQDEETRSIACEVVRGVAGYGNALGIPNLGGDTVFDTGYNLSCLVNVVTVGIIREDEIIHSYVPAEAGKVGYDIIIIGKATDRSGFGGAAFASVTLDEDAPEKNAGAVQEPNPFLERHLLASTYALFDWLKRENKLDKVSFKDHGAGGNVCASVEQVAPAGMGAVVDLDKIHVGLQGLPPEVIACAETQERFCWICHPSLTQDILKHYNQTWDLPGVAEGARASVVGKVQEDPMYTLLYKGEKVCHANAQDITSGLQYVRPTKAPAVTWQEPTISCDGASVTVGKDSVTIADVFKAMIAHPTHASKSRVIRHYDKNIIGNTLIEPGEGDGGVIMPLSDLKSYEVDGIHPDWQEALKEEQKYVGVVLASGGNGRYGRVSPYLQGVNAAVENMCNVAACGALPRAITDCLNYGNPEVPEQLFALEEGVKGISDAAKGVAIGGEAVPIISGNVSLYNVTKDGPIDPTGVVCVVGVMPDARKAVDMRIKKTGSVLCLIGDRKDECGGSAYYQLLEQVLKRDRNTLLGKNVPNPDFAIVKKQIGCVHEVISSGKVLSCHDISDGGLILALFEMTAPQRKVGGEIGVEVDIAAIKNALRTDAALFSETGGFLIELDPSSLNALQDMAKAHGVAAHVIGKTAGSSFVVHDGKTQVINTPLKDLHAVWSTALDKAMRSI